MNSDLLSLLSLVQLLHSSILLNCHKAKAEWGEYLQPETTRLELTHSTDNKLQIYKLQTINCRSQIAVSAPPHCAPCCNSVKTYLLPTVTTAVPPLNQVAVDALFITQIIKTFNIKLNQGSKNHLKLKQISLPVNSY